MPNDENRLRGLPLHGKVPQMRTLLFTGGYVVEFGSVFRAVIVIVCCVSEDGNDFDGDQERITTG